MFDQICGGFGCCVKLMSAVTMKKGARQTPALIERRRRQPADGWQNGDSRMLHIISEVTTKDNKADHDSGPCALVRRMSSVARAAGRPVGGNFPDDVANRTMPARAAAAFMHVLRGGYSPTVPLPCVPFPCSPAYYYCVASPRHLAQPRPDLVSSASAAVCVSSFSWARPSFVRSNIVEPEPGILVAQRASRISQ